MDGRDEEVRSAGALRFDPAADRAPRLVAYGTGEIAREIALLARENRVPLVRDAALTEVFAALPVGREIPENLYRAVSGIFALIYKLEISERSPRESRTS